MAWTVVFQDQFEQEIAELEAPVRRQLLGAVILLRAVGPRLGRPYADTLSGSRHANMKELRFTADGGVWRAAYAFDPERRAVVLVAADKRGIATARFYKALIAKADRRFDDHLAALSARKG